MRTPLSSYLPALAAIALSGACAHNPQPAAPAPQAAPPPAASPTRAAPAAVDLAGDWNFVADFDGQRMVGVIQLRRSGTAYTGTATPSDAEGSASLTSLTIVGSRVVMLFDTPDGEARAEAVVEGGNTMNGTVTYAGHSGNFTARKL
jgi:hypothetical protein